LNRSEGLLFGVLNIIGDVYKKPKKSGLTDWKGCLKVAFENEVPHFFAIKLLNEKEFDLEAAVYLQRLKEEWERWFYSFKRTVTFLDAALEKQGLPYLLIKTYRCYPWLTHDVDILVMDFKSALKKLKDYGLYVHFTEKNQAMCVRRDLIPIGLHGKISWSGVTCLEEKFLWDNFRRVRIEEIEINIPSVEGDIATYLAHIIFEQHRITLGELLYTYKFSSKVKWDLLWEQASNNCWLKSFKALIGILNGFHKELYDEPSPIWKYIPLTSKVNLILPYWYPLGELIRPFLEKRKPLSLIRIIPFYISERYRTRFPKTIEQLSLLLHSLSNYSPWRPREEIN
jgi:hypothetical protein